MKKSILLFCLLLVSSFSVFSENEKQVAADLHLSVGFVNHGYIKHAEPVMYKVGNKLFFDKNTNLVIHEFEPNFISIELMNVPKGKVGEWIAVQYDLFKNNLRFKTIVRIYKEETSVEEIVKEVNNMAFDYYINN